MDTVNMSNGGLSDFLSQVGLAAHPAQNSGNRPASISETNADWAKTLATAACWAQTGNSYFPVSNVVKAVPPGAYKCMVSDQGPYLEKMLINIDHLLSLPDSATEILLEEFSQFWKLRTPFDDRGFTFKRGMLMWGPPGCLAANTELRYSTRDPDGKKRTSKVSTIERLYQAFNRIKGHKRGQYQLALPDSVHYVASVDDEGKVFRNRVVNVIKSGAKECFLLKTESGLAIEATSDHKFRSEGKFLPLTKLMVGDTVEVHINNPVNISERKEKKSRKFVYVKHHPFARVKFAGDGKYKYHVLPFARAVVEANMNGLHVDNYIEKLNTGFIDFKFLKKSDDVHHKDEDCTNDFISNLEVIDHSEHQKLHGLQEQDLWYVTTDDVITSITSVGVKETYDIQMETPYNNFVASNFVVHNSGKTSAIWQMTQRLIKDLAGAVLFVDNPQNVIWCINILRRIEPTRPIITVMEDIDAIIQQHGEHALLALLDGEFQTDNVVHIATTNYPQYLDRRFVDRPSRFDTIMQIGMPSEAARKVYFRAKESSLSDSDLERWVRLTKGYSIAHLREVIIAIKCFGQSEEDVFERLDAMRDAIQVNEYGEARQRVGFTAVNQVKRHR